MSIKEPKKIRRTYKAQFMSKRWKEQKREGFQSFCARLQRGAFVKRAVAVVLVVALLGGAVTLIHGQRTLAAAKQTEELQQLAEGIVQNVGKPTTDIVALGSSIAACKTYEFITDDATQSFGDGVNSQFGILIDLEDDHVVAARDPETKMYPASMTKVLTVLVAAEHIKPEQLDDMCTVTFDTTNYSYINECSVVGFEVGEQVSVRDLFYGTILCSGADASLTLAEYVSGTQDEFVKLMNDKLEQLGISGSSHFTNCVGLFDENHYTTAHDMAVIMAAALDNELCAEVLKTREHNIDPNEFHPDGQWLYDKFIGWIEDQEINGTVIGAKTGYVMESGNCCVSALLSNGGHRYICVTGKAQSSLMERLDHVAIYQNYTK